MIKAVIFDLDDTLLKTKETKWQKLKFAAKHFYNLDLADETLRANWGKPFPEFMSLVFGNADKLDNILHNYKSIVNMYPNQSHENAIATVESLGEKYLLGIVSSAARYLIEKDLVDAGFDLGIFQIIQSAEDTDVHKPDPGVFKPLLQKLKIRHISAAETIFTGDTLYDCQAAIGAGIRFIGVSGRTATSDDFRQAGIKSISDLKELETIIKQL